MWSWFYYSQVVWKLHWETDRAHSSNRLLAMLSPSSRIILTNPFNVSLLNHRFPAQAAVHQAGCHFSSYIYFLNITVKATNNQS